jgi:predicted esterase
MSEIRGATEGRIQVQGVLNFDYFKSGPEASDAKELVLLLHGYMESGKRIFEKLVSSFPKEIAVIAPNGPFLIPIKKSDGYKAGFSWYFHDPASNDYFINMETAVSYLSGGIEKLGFKSHPKRIIGFSQGGYLALILGSELDHTRQVIGIACEYLFEELVKPVLFRVDAIHGDLDSVVSLEGAKTSHVNLKKLGVKGDFHTIPNLDHRISNEVKDSLSKLVTLV